MRAVTVLKLAVHRMYSYKDFFFFQAEDGIRDLTVTGVQTCALPISGGPRERPPLAVGRRRPRGPPRVAEIGRASCRGKSVDLGGRRIIKKKKYWSGQEPMR